MERFLLLCCGVGDDGTAEGEVGCVDGGESGRLVIVLHSVGHA